MIPVEVLRPIDPELLIKFVFSRLNSVFRFRTVLAQGTSELTPGDFNGDGLMDVILTTAAGSYQYLGLSGGGYRTDAWVRTDLSVGRVKYTPGDFNGDGRTDLIVTTASGSSEYLGLSAGGFTPNVWLRPDLSLGSVEYTPGDFNGDRKTDLIITAAIGSYEYAGRAGGGFTQDVWVRWTWHLAWSRTRLGTSTVMARRI